MTDRLHAVSSAASIVVARHRAGLTASAAEFLELELVRACGFGPGGDRCGMSPGDATYLTAKARRLAPEVEQSVGLAPLGANVVPLTRTGRHA